jgi:hypothetical protein
LDFFGAPFRTIEQWMNVLRGDVPHRTAQLPDMAFITGAFQPCLCLRGNNA